MLNIFFVILSMAAIMFLFDEKRPKSLRVPAHFAAALGTAAILIVINTASGFILTDLFGVLAIVFLIAASVRCAADTVIFELNKSKKSIRRLKREKEREKNSVA